jgi:hypothetical protein
MSHLNVDPSWKSDQHLWEFQESHRLSLALVVLPLHYVHVDRHPLHGASPVVLGVTDERIHQILSNHSLLKFQVVGHYVDF